MNDDIVEVSRADWQEETIGQSEPALSQSEKKPKGAPILVHSVSNDFEDDYEEDEFESTAKSQSLSRSRSQTNSGVASTSKAPVAAKGSNLRTVGEIAC